MARGIRYYNARQTPPTTADPIRDTIATDAFEEAAAAGEDPFAALEQVYRSIPEDVAPDPLIAPRTARRNWTR